VRDYLIADKRARLHRSIAATLVQQPADALPRADHADELAFHLDRVGDIDGAFCAFLAAADAAEMVAPASRTARATMRSLSAGSVASASNTCRTSVSDP